MRVDPQLAHLAHDVVQHVVVDVHEHEQDADLAAVLGQRSGLGQLERMVSFLWSRTVARLSLKDSRRDASLRVTLGRPSPCDHPLILVA